MVGGAPDSPGRTGGVPALREKAMQGLRVGLQYSKQEAQVGTDLLRPAC